MWNQHSFDRWNLLHMNPRCCNRLEHPHYSNMGIVQVRLELQHCCCNNNRWPPKQHVGKLGTRLWISTWPYISTLKPFPKLMWEHMARGQRHQLVGSNLRSKQCSLWIQFAPWCTVIFDNCWNSTCRQGDWLYGHNAKLCQQRSWPPETPFMRASVYYSLVSGIWKASSN